MWREGTGRWDGGGGLGNYKENRLSDERLLSFRVPVVRELQGQPRVVDLLVAEANLLVAVVVVQVVELGSRKKIFVRSYRNTVTGA